MLVCYTLVRWRQQTMKVRHPFYLKTNYVIQLHYQIEK